MKQMDNRQGNRSMGAAKGRTGFRSSKWNKSASTFTTPEQGQMMGSVILDVHRGQ